MHLRAFRASIIIVWIQYSLFSLQLRVLKDRYEFEYRLDHLCQVILDYVSHSMSLTCFLPKTFVFLSWLDTSIHFAVTYLMFWDMFIYHDHFFYTVHLSRARYTILCLIIDLIFNSMLIFLLRKSERHIFTFTHFSRDPPWSPYHFFLITLSFFFLLWSSSWRLS